MKTELVYALGWVAFGVGWVLRGVAELRTDGLGWLTTAFLGCGVSMVALAVVGYTTPERSGAPNRPNYRLYGIVLAGLAMLALGAVEVAFSS